MGIDEYGRISAAYLWYSSRTAIIAEKIESFHPIKSASTVAGLLSDSAFHANTLRLELLIQLFVAYARGSQQPSTGDLDCLLN